MVKTTLKTAFLAMMLAVTGTQITCSKANPPEMKASVEMEALVAMDASIEMDAAAKMDAALKRNASAGMDAETELERILPIPFRIHLEPMDRLLLINFEDDPDSLYKGFEPQVFDDTVNGRGQLVIGWRVDGRVDVYHDHALSPDPVAYDIAGKGLANMVERDLSGSRFLVDEFGVQAHYGFEDIHGRWIEFSVSERNTRERRPFGLLAPMGDAVENPPAMPLILLHEFYFVRQKDSDVSIRIGGREHATDMLPMPIDRSRMTFVRYCTDPLIAMLNPAMDGAMKILRLDGHISVQGELPASESMAVSGDTEYMLQYVDGVPVLGGLQRRSCKHVLKLTFDPPFPNLVHMKADEKAEGSFTIAGDPSTGSIHGHYGVSTADELIEVVMVPSGGWSPVPDRLSLRVLYRVARVFRKWPETYRWTASIIRDNSGQEYYTGQEDYAQQWHMQSEWERIDR
ncbi:MAG: hypothetical protein EA363_08880 [Balneolaceae bacterium]|nr:MAG: hypothetical protein EA363_08880 [Balneolaceae bacterium]